eukprot:213604-Chlamydomonas_euryale.AAC.4
MQIVKRLYGTLPVVVNGDNWEAIGEELDDIFVGDAELWRRSNDDRSQPRGGDDPYVSPEGHNLIDIRFVDTLKLFGEEEPYEKILSEIRSVDGVYSYGLLLQEAEAAVVADAEGEPGLEGTAASVWPYGKAYFPVSTANVRTTRPMSPRRAAHADRTATHAVPMSSWASAGRKVMHMLQGTLLTLSMPAEPAKTAVGRAVPTLCVPTHAL